jgi:hypothetical protein
MPEDIISGDDCADALEMLSYPGKQSVLFYLINRLFHHNI